MKSVTYNRDDYVVNLYMPQKGHKQSPEHIAKRIKSGSEHPNWKGSDITEKSGRARALALYPDIPPCVICGSQRSERHHIDENTRNNDPSNILPLCRKCHMRKDGRLARFILSAKRRQSVTVQIAAQKKLSRTQCKNGHDYTEVNTRISNGKRVCRECIKINAARYQERKCQ